MQVCGSSLPGTVHRSATAATVVLHWRTCAARSRRPVGVGAAFRAGQHRADAARTQHGRLAAAGRAGACCHTVLDLL